MVSAMFRQSRALVAAPRVNAVLVRCWRPYDPRARAGGLGSRVRYPPGRDHRAAAGLVGGARLAAAELAAELAAGRAAGLAGRAEE
eukprot:2880611-Pyramimonas_sp.AAC.1